MKRPYLFIIMLIITDTSLSLSLQGYLIFYSIYRIYSWFLYSPIGLYYNHYIFLTVFQSSPSYSPCHLPLINQLEVSHEYGG